MREKTRERQSIREVRPGTRARLGTGVFAECVRGRSGLGLGGQHKGKGSKRLLGTPVKRERNVETRMWCGLGCNVYAV